MFLYWLLFLFICIFPLNRPLGQFSLYVTQSFGMHGDFKILWRRRRRILQKKPLKMPESFKTPQAIIWWTQKRKRFSVISASFKPFQDMNLMNTRKSSTMRSKLSVTSVSLFSRMKKDLNVIKERSKNLPFHLFLKLMDIWKRCWSGIQATAKEESSSNPNSQSRYSFSNFKFKYGGHNSLNEHINRCREAQDQTKKVSSEHSTSV